MSSRNVPSRRRAARRLALLAAAVAVPVPAPVLAGHCWSPPVTAPISDPFREPACRWCPGNRGVEFRTPSGVTVRAVATGRVSFVGTVAGTAYLTVRLPDGRRVTYGRLAATGHRRGDLVLRGVVVGRTTGRLHLGVRDDDRYLDPQRWLGTPVGRPRLIPASGARARPAPPPTLRCSG